MAFNSEWVSNSNHSDRRRSDVEKRNRVLQSKLDDIASYIAAQAHQLEPPHTGDIRKVPCPSITEWNGLAAGGRHAQLPSSATLMMSVPDNLRTFAAQHGYTNTLVAWFEAARAQLIAQRAAAQKKKS